MPHKFLHFSALFIYHHADAVAGEEILHFVRALEIKLQELFPEPRICHFLADKLRNVFVLHFISLLLLDA